MSAVQILQLEIVAVVSTATYFPFIPSTPVRERRRGRHWRACGDGTDASRAPQGPDKKQQQPDLGSSGTRRGQAADTKSELCDVRTAACCRSCRAIRSLQNGPVSIAIMCSVPARSYWAQRVSFKPETSRPGHVRPWLSWGATQLEAPSLAHVRRGRATRRSQDRAWLYPHVCGQCKPSVLFTVVHQVWLSLQASRA